MDTHDTLPSLLLFFDNFRVIFNAREVSGKKNLKASELVSLVY